MLAYSGAFESHCSVLNNILQLDTAVVAEAEIEVGWEHSRATGHFEFENVSNHDYQLYLKGSDSEIKNRRQSTQSCSCTPQALVMSTSWFHKVCFH